MTIARTSAIKRAPSIKVQRTHRRLLSRGFTLIETVVVISIIAIAAAIAVPSLQGMIQTNRVASEVNNFVADLMYARVQAVKSGKTVTICSSSTGTACQAGTTWNRGYLVYSLADDGTTIVPLRYRAAWASTDVFTPTPAITSFSYQRTGFVGGLSGGSVSMRLYTSPLNNTATRCVVVNLVGHQELQTSGGSNCV